MSENQRKETIIELTAIIDKIQLKLSELTIDLEAAKRSIAALNEETNTTTKSSSTTRLRRLKRDKEGPSKNKVDPSPPAKKHVYSVGNRIKILNPTSYKQTGLGRVTGYTRAGLVKFDLDNGISTCRKSKNLILISES